MCGGFWGGDIRLKITKRFKSLYSDKQHRKSWCVRVCAHHKLFRVLQISKDHRLHSPTKHLEDYLHHIFQGSIPKKQQTKKTSNNKRTGEQTESRLKALQVRK